MYKVQSAKARKRYQAVDGVIEPGQVYFFFTPRSGSRFLPVRRFVKRPRDSQRTDSEYLREVYSLREQLEDAGKLDADACEELRSNVEALRDSEQEKFDNMEQYNLQEGDTGALIEERIAALEDFLSVLESIDFEEGRDPEEIAQEVLEQWPE